MAKKSKPTATYSYADEDGDDSTISQELQEWQGGMRDSVQDFADAILGGEDDVDFSATLEELGVMERESSVKSFSYGVMRVDLDRKHKKLKTKLRRRRSYLHLHYKKEAEERSEKIPTERDREAKMDADHEIVGMEDRLIELEYKRDLTDQAIRAITERNRIIPGIQGQRRQIDAALDSERKRQ